MIRLPAARPVLSITTWLVLWAVALAQEAQSPQVAWRCRGTIGGWCGLYDKQAPIVFKATPRGDKECPVSEYGMCSKVGNCNHDTGLCECPAGWQGADCSVKLLRPCTNRFRDKSTDPPAGHIDEAGRDLDPMADGFTESRCIGVCDADIGRCFCDGKHGRVNAPPGSPPGTPPVKRGRPLGNHLCQPNDDGKGGKMPWGQHPWQDIYGVHGWCEADHPKLRCGCLYDGIAGETCEITTEMFCPNQCSGHGECDLGFCRCHEGWYGTDCARRKAGLPLEPGMQDPGTARGYRPWIQPVTHVPVAATIDPGSNPGTRPLRKRPLIYVYDLPPAYNARMLQYRVERVACTWRSFTGRNDTERTGGTLYGIEQLFHELLLQSEHRTFNPEEADYFYMPLYTSCFIFPIHCWADGPWWHTPSGPRVMHVTNMMIEARDWVRAHFPWWDRRGGKDHIWLMTHDEGACYAPTDIFKSSIFLTHWGRLDANHRSNTAFTPDNYTQEWKHPVDQPIGWLHLIEGHPCYDPKKDLVIPSLKMPHTWHWSPLAAAPRQKRSLLLFFRGDVGKHRLEWYSRGIRQKLYKLAVGGGWEQKYNIRIGGGEDIQGDYSLILASSRYCAVLPGDGWSARMEDAALHGCIPVIIMDDVHAVFESILDYPSFSVRVAEKDLEKVPEILAAIPEEKEKAMRKALRRVWHRFAYTTHPLLKKDTDDMITSNPANKAGQSRNSLPDADNGTAPRMPRPFPHGDDAFHTIMQWLYARLPHTRG